MLFNLPSTYPDETSGFCRSSNAEFNLFVGTAHSRVAVLVVSSTISLSTLTVHFSLSFGWRYLSVPTVPTVTEMGGFGLRKPSRKPSLDW